MYDNWVELEQCIKNCRKCDLCNKGSNTILGEGNVNAEVMFISEEFDINEDEIVSPIGGKAGYLINEAFKAVGIEQKDVYITNIIKCRLSKNKNTYEKEVQECLDYLRNQVILVKPRIIVLLGNVALTSILGKGYSIISERGKWIEKKKIKYMSTFHPTELLNDDSKKILFYKDLKNVKREMNS